MARRAQLAMKRLLNERANDPEPTWADAIGHAWWARREDQRHAEITRWHAYLP